jgi:transposase
MPEPFAVRGVFQLTGLSFRCDCSGAAHRPQVMPLRAAWHCTHRSIVMEGLSPLHRRVAGIDVHRMLHVVTVLIEQPDGSIDKHRRDFGGFKRDCRALAQWLSDLQVQLVVMESTGIYWKSVFSNLENAGITAWVVNAHFIKHVPGRKTDMLDSEWLAVLARWCAR